MSKKGMKIRWVGSYMYIDIGMGMVLTLSVGIKLTQPF